MKPAPPAAALDDVLALLAEQPKLSGRDIEEALSAGTTHTRGATRSAVKLGIRTGRIVTEKGPRRAVLHSQCASAPEFATSAPAHWSECASAPIEGALHSDTQQGSSAPAADHPICGSCGQRLLTDASIARGVCVRCQPIPSSSDPMPEWAADAYDRER